MSGAANVSSNPTGEVRPQSRKFARNQARRWPALPRERCGAPSTAFEGQRGLPYATKAGIIATQLHRSGECRLMYRPRM